MIVYMQASVGIFAGEWAETGEYATVGKQPFVNGFVEENECGG